MNVPIVHVPCPRDNPDEMIRNYEEAQQLFNNYCPAAAKVADVAGVREKGQLKCAWIVKYVRKPGFEHINPEALALQIRIHKPMNTIISKQIKQFPPGLILTYTIECMCPVSPSAGMDSEKSLKMNFEGDIKLENLKLEDAREFPLPLVGNV